MGILFLEGQRGCSQTWVQACAGACWRHAWPQFVAAVAAHAKE